MLRLIKYLLNRSRHACWLCALALSIAGDEQVDYRPDDWNYIYCDPGPGISANKGPILWVIPKETSENYRRYREEDDLRRRRLRRTYKETWPDRYTPHDEEGLPIGRGLSGAWYIHHHGFPMFTRPYLKEAIKWAEVWDLRTVHYFSDWVLISWTSYDYRLDKSFTQIQELNLSPVWSDAPNADGEDTGSMRFFVSTQADDTSCERLPTERGRKLQITWQNEVEASGTLINVLQNATDWMRLPIKPPLD